ncbi:hypothetical protein [Embleya sp. NPDC059237]|uniref:hypothetical protein n=1 Tax=Embleya sp. NPDC059237 TaxID=3346784 RepID=UPI0036A79F0F
MTKPQKTAPPPAPEPRTRPRASTTAYPLILLDGDDPAWQLRTAAEFTTSPRVGPCYWLDLGDASGDAFAEGSGYRIVDHDGTWTDVLAQIEAVADAADHAAEHGLPPVGLVLNSASTLWRMLVSWVHDRARRSDLGQRRLRKDPDARIEVDASLWDEATERHAHAMWLMRTMPATVVLLARSRHEVATDDDGRVAPDTRRDIDGQKLVAWEATVRVRRNLGDPHPVIVSSRSPRLPIPDTEPLPSAGFTVDALVFDVLGCATKAAPPVRVPRPAGDRAQVWLREVAAAGDVDALQKVWDSAHADPTLPVDQWRVVRSVIERKAGALDEDERDAGGEDLDIVRLRAAHARHKAGANPS